MRSENENVHASTASTAHSSEIHWAIKVTQRLALVALIASILFIGFNVYKVITLRKHVKELSAQAESFNNQLKELDTKIKERQQKLEELNADYSKLLTAANAARPKPPAFEDIHPRAKAEPIPNSQQHLYNFTVWLDAPPDVLASIQNAVYIFDHPTFTNKQLVGDDPKKGFAVSYRGWGALRLVTIKVQLKSGVSHTYYFDMLKALNWDSD